MQLNKFFLKVRALWNSITLPEVAFLIKAKTLAYLDYIKTLWGKWVSLPVKEKQIEGENSEEIPGVRKNTRKGFIIILLFVILFFGWGGLFPIESASIASGQVTFDSYRKTIQHLEGGIVKEIYIKDGAQVEKNEPLVALENIQARSERTRLEERYLKLKMQQARLALEIKKTLVFSIPKKLQHQINVSHDTEVNSFFKTQSELFYSRKLTYQSTLDIYSQRLEQLTQEIESLQSKVTSFDTQLKYLKAEIVATEKLLKREYVSKTRYWELLRTEADLKGKRDENTALIARTRQKLGETRSQVLNFKNEWNSEILKEFSVVDLDLSDTEKYLNYAKDVQTRTIIRSPIAGTVEGLKMHTIGGVIKPTEAIMDIVPKTDALVVEVKINPLDIDVVHMGLLAKVYLTAYDIRHLPSVEGEVTYISSDIFQDQTTNEKYYSARVTIKRSEMEKLKDVKLHPGMPAEIMIITDKQTFLSYLFKPISKSFDAAFREK